MTADDLIEALKDSAEHDIYFEITGLDAKVLYEYITALKLRIDLLQASAQDFYQRQ